MSFPAYILAGGHSRRFGSDKARALLHGRPLIVRLADRLQDLASRVVVVAERPGKYADLELETIADKRHDQGPLAGLETALDDAQRTDGIDWILLVSCDLAIVRGEWIETLALSATDNHMASAFADDRWHPFPGLYHTDLASIVAEYLEAPPASFQRLLSDPRAHTARPPLPPDWPATPQVNTPEDLKDVDPGRGSWMVDSGS